MKSKLLLYIDTNIIVPVSCDPSGRTHETESILYNGIIDLSHIEIIQDFYQKTTGVNTIDTHFVFAETIETPLKKKIMETFSKEGIKPVSFTTNPSIVLTEYALKQIPGGENSFGDNVAVIYSNDDSLRLTGTIYDGNGWQWNASNSRIPKVGNSPLKRCLVECLINERDKNLGAIDNRNREQEIAYQMQFADEWLQLYKNSRMLESNEDLIVNFKFSFEDSNVRLRLSKREIELSYEKTLAPAISSIVEYKEKKCSNAIKYAILVGPAFEEENFTSKVKNALDCNEQFSVIPYVRLSSVFAKYLSACELEDNYAKFDQISRTNENIFKNTLDWIQYAQLLTEFNENLSSELRELSIRVDEDTEMLKSVIQATDLHMQKSVFSEARLTLNKTMFPSTLVSNSIQEARLLLAKKENLEGVFAKLECVDGARQLINKIEDNSDKLKAGIGVSESHREAIANKSKRIDYCEEHYDKYLDLKREFNKAATYKDKVELVLKMKDVSDEPMPELKFRQVFAEIKYTKEKVKVSFFKKKDVLHITVNVKDDEKLPCTALLNISNKVLIRASDGDAECLAYEIEKGENTFSVDLESTDCQLDFNKPIYCYVFVGRNVLDKAAIKCDSVVIK